MATFAIALFMHACSMCAYCHTASAVLYVRSLCSVAIIAKRDGNKLEKTLGAKCHCLLKNVTTGKSVAMVTVIPLFCGKVSSTHPSSALQFVSPNICPDNLTPVDRSSSDGGNCLHRISLALSSEPINKRYSHLWSTKSI